MTIPGAKNPRLGTYVVKKFGDESFRVFARLGNQLGLVVVFTGIRHYRH
jgi:hypothetical protein